MTADGSFKNFRIILKIFLRPRPTTNLVFNTQKNKFIWIITWFQRTNLINILEGSTSTFFFLKRHYFGLQLIKMRIHINIRQILVNHLGAMDAKLSSFSDMYILACGIWRITYFIRYIYRGPEANVKTRIWQRHCPLDGKTTTVSTLCLLYDIIEYWKIS